VKRGCSLKRKLSVNKLALNLLREMIKNPDFYGVKVERLTLGTTLIDAGITVKGGYEAGRLITEICMGGCAKAQITCKKYGNLELPSIFVYTDHPIIATLGSQYAGWQINEEGYFAIGSGPARALALKPKRIFMEIQYKDDFEKAIMILETEKYPSETLIEQFAEDCHVHKEDLLVILVPTASVAGATQIAGRTIETGIHKLKRLGLDLKTIVNAWGCAPIPPTHPRFVEAMARTNDAILYGGMAQYSVRCDDDKSLRNILRKAPSKASKTYGKPFADIFREANEDFYKIDPDLFAPAVVGLYNVSTGKSYINGEINAELLSMSFGF
jgi:methenyltetrahydromethanopterin cyclohydrolase